MLYRPQFPQLSNETAYPLEICRIIGLFSHDPNAVLFRQMNFSFGTANLHVRHIVDWKIKDLATLGRSRFTPLALISFLQNQSGAANDDDEHKQNAGVFAFHAGTISARPGFACGQ